MSWRSDVELNKRPGGDWSRIQIAGVEGARSISPAIIPMPRSSQYVTAASRSTEYSNYSTPL